MHRLARLCLATALLLLCGASPPAHPRTILAGVPISRMDQSWWRERHEAKLAELRSNRVDLIFLGDSITQDWEYEGPPEWRDFAPMWQRFYGDRHAVNLGFVGDTTANLLWRIENGEVAGITPKVAVILIGANNLGRVHWSTEDTLAGIDEIVAQLRHRLPQTKLLLLGVLPSDRSAWVTETTAAINRGLAAKYGHSGDVTYLDVGHVFMQGNRLNRDLFADPKMTPPRAPLHPSAQGQALMSQAMEPTLATLLGDRRHDVTH
jgi:lysophospholipase L1-like esterase